VETTRSAGRPRRSVDSVLTQHPLKCLCIAECIVNGIVVVHGDAPAFPLLRVLPGPGQARIKVADAPRGVPKGRRTPS
jgi:hypothetical protein